MVIKTQKGMYEVIKNIRDAYNEEKFNEAYLEEYFDAYDYIVGDIASDTIRLKGFSTNPNNKSYYKMIPDYLTESCAYKGAYYILRRIGEEEYQRLFEKYKNNPNKDVTIGDDTVETLEKVAYDKDSLVLEPSIHRDPHIVLDMQKINKVKTFPLPDDLKDDAEDLKQSQRFNNQRNKEKNIQNKNNPQNNINQNKGNNNQKNPQSNLNNNKKPNNNQNINNQNSNNSFSNNQNKRFSNSNNKKAFSNNKK